MIRHLVLLSVVPTLAQAQPTPARMMTQYAIIGPVAVDTAEVSAAFQTGLVLDSLVRILPSLPNTDAARQLRGRLEASPGWISLECSVVGRRGKLRTSWIDNTAADRVVLDSALAVPLDSLPSIAEALGRTAARRLHALPPAAPSPNER